MTAAVDVCSIRQGAAHLGSAERFSAGVVGHELQTGRGDGIIDRAKYGTHVARLGLDPCRVRL